MSIAAPPMPAPLAVWSPPAVPTLPVRRVTIDEYHRMIDSGFFAEDEAFELIHGWVVPKMTKNPPHTIATGLLQDSLSDVAPPGFHVRSQDPVTLTESEPEPDGCLVRGDRRDYTRRHPTAADVPLLAEVSDSSLDRDQGEKLIAYALAGIAVYWIVNLIDLRVEVYDQPSGASMNPGYGRQRIHVPGDSVPVVIDGHEVGRVAVNDLLP